jgi:hypothetical protein
MDPGSGMGKKSRSGSGMNVPDHIPESLETFSWVKILKFFYVDPDPGSRIFLTLDPGSGIFLILDGKKLGSGINIPDLQHCNQYGSATLCFVLIIGIFDITFFGVATSGLLPGSPVHIRIKMPVKLSQEQRQIMEDFARLETDTPGNSPEGTVSRDQSKSFFTLDGRVLVLNQEKNFVEELPVICSLFQIRNVWIRIRIR